MANDTLASKPMAAVHAIRGVQQGREFYTAMIALQTAADFCVSRDALEDGDIPIQYRRQRELSKVRTTRLFRYLLHAAMDKTDYVLPALTCTIDGCLEFVPVDDGPTGLLRFEVGRPWFLADGQHRVEAIKRLRAVYRKGEVGRVKLTREQNWRLQDVLIAHVPITIFHEAGDQVAQQIFADINRNSSKPPRELLDAFDHRSKSV